MSFVKGINSNPKDSEASGTLVMDPVVTVSFTFMMSSGIGFLKSHMLYQLRIAHRTSCGHSTSIR